MHTNRTVPFEPLGPIRSLADVERIEQRSLDSHLGLDNVYQLFQNTARVYGERTAVRFVGRVEHAGDDETLSYAQLLGAIHQTGNLLHRLGVGPQDAVGILLPASASYHRALWGAACSAIALPLNPLLSDAMLVALLASAEAKVVFACRDGQGGPLDTWQQVLRLLPQLPGVRAVVVESAEPIPADELPAGTPCLHYATARQAEPDHGFVAPRQIQGSERVAYFHTGGTTGQPKLAIHTHRAQVVSAWSAVVMQGLRPSDVIVNGYPLFHVAGAIPISLGAFSCGAEVLMPTATLYRNRAVIQNFWKLVERYRATVLSAVPTVLTALTQVPVADSDISSVRYWRTGAAPLLAELAAAFEAVSGHHAHEGYGMTEMAGISAVRPLGVRGLAGCVGFRIPFSQLRIVEPEAAKAGECRDVAPGAVGLVLFQSANLFSGYLNEPGGGSALLGDGWLDTGDLGRLDEHGQLYICGRAKDLIIRSGHNIDPAAIEDAIASHAAVEQCVAVGAPDGYAGELPVAFVTLKPGASASEAELLAHAARGVADAVARPRSVTIVDILPTTAVGKIFKPALKQLAARQVITGLVDEAWAALTPRPTGPARQAATVVEVEGGWEVRIAGALPAAQAGALAMALASRLQFLPVRASVRQPQREPAAEAG